MQAIDGNVFGLKLTGKLDGPGDNQQLGAAIADPSPEKGAERRVFDAVPNEFMPD